MPDLVPVEHDPFAATLVPVEHDPFDPLAASAGVAPPGPTPVGLPMLQHVINLGLGFGRTAAGQQPQQSGYWSDLDEAQAQANARGLQVAGPEIAMMMVGAPGGAGGLGSGVRAPRAGLPMDEASRMARAVEQGFTRDAYRGEGAPIVGDKFIEGHPSRYDTGYLGGEAIYSTNAPRLANDYASFKAYKLRPDDEAQNVMPLRVKLENPLVIPGEEKTRIAQLPQHERDAWLRNVYKSGHDGVLVKYSGGYEEYVAPAAQYRSRFAAFDPVDKDSGFLLGSGATDKELSTALTGLNATQGIRAYHGSPHDFERFDISKIGTGEGAQAYGHGLYFAENPDVAVSYRPEERVAGETLGWRTQGRDPQVVPLLHAHNGDIDAAIAHAQNSNPKRPVNGVMKGLYDDAIPDLLEMKKEGQQERIPKGRMYEVSINADPEHFLDWDKPLSEQSEKVRQAIAKAGLVPQEADLGSFAGQPVRSAPRWADTPEQAAALRDAGIPGIKYLDQGSRLNPAVLPDNPIANEARKFLNAAGGNSQKAGELFYESNPVSRWAAPERDEIFRIIQTGGNKPTHNYVVFDDKLIDIIKKYGLAGLIAGGAAHFSTMPVDHNPFATQ